MSAKLLPLLLLFSLHPAVSLARDSVEISSKTGGQAEFVVTVWCRDGAFYKGEPLEYVPNDHVTLRLADGKTLRIEWERVANVAGIPGKREPDPGQPVKRPPATPRPQPSPASLGSSEPAFDAFSSSKERRRMIRSESPDTVVVNMPLMPGNTHVPVRFTGMKEGAMIEYLASSAEISGWSWPGGYVSGSADTWKAICALPCRLNADRDRALRISGSEIVDSKTFLLPTRGDRFEVEIKPGWESTRTAAWAVMGVGIGVGVVGSIIAGLGQSKWAEPVPQNFFITGSSLVGAGLVLTLSSIPVFVKSRTDVVIYSE